MASGVGTVAAEGAKGLAEQKAMNATTEAIQKESTVEDVRSGIAKALIAKLKSQAAF